MTNISIIVAVSDNNVIGRNGTLPWQVKADMKYFHQKTKNHIIICGRKTHESIVKRLGHPLKNRKTIVMTKQKHYKMPKNCVQALSWEKAIKAAKAKERRKVFVIGGEEIFKIALPHAKKMYITRIHKIVDDGDAFFPEYDKNEWKLADYQHHCCDTIENKSPFTLETWERRKK
ncbi:MAG: dihydrofolate reductase [Candidatus Brennerbacteria bacterium]|nr:dihydrofolate reductase [Candidatus Brennerbacteria bacterium]